MKNPFKRKKKPRGYIIDTSMKGFEYIGVKLTEQQFQDLCLLNTILIGKNDEHRQNIPVFNAVLFLKILGLLPNEMLCDTSADDADSNPDCKISQSFQRKFGKIKS